MRKVVSILIFCFSAMSWAQETGTIEGVLTDKEENDQPLPFANVLIKGTTKGATTDFDGKYIIENIPVGTYSVEFSFVGYETVEVPNVVVQANKFTNVSTALGASAAALDEVLITVQTSREREEALLLEQKRAVEIVESLGAQQLSKLGVTDAATATTKISGVTVSESSGDIFVRGLGDRYLYTTMNGLPIPSDDVERKNINLGLFSTRAIQSVGISKTYSAGVFADQASGNIDISTKELSGTKELSIGLRVGANTNALQDGVRNNFVATANQSDYKFGFLSDQGFTKARLPAQFVNDVDYRVYPRLTQQTWNTGTVGTPVNYRYAISAGKKFGEKLKVFLTASQSSNFNYRQGLFRQYRQNAIRDTLTDATTYSHSITSTGLLNVDYKLNDQNSFRYVSLFINDLNDEVFEGGRNGEGVFFEETQPAEGLSQFVRDQNTRQTSLWVNQLFGEHKIKKHELSWSLGFNLLNADEPNRIRNEVNFNEDLVQLGRNGGFQQRKSFQFIDDIEYAGILKDVISFKDDEEGLSELTVGINYRNKQRDFKSQFLGVEESATNVVNPSSIDNLREVFTLSNFENGVLQLNVLPTDRYEGELDSKAAFTSYNLEVGKFNVNAGIRYQRDLIDVTFDVNNFAGRTGISSKEYDNLYMTANLKYNIDDEQGVRFASSRTITLPEFKEIAPFEYVSPVGQVTRGNPDLQASINYNFDLKYEWFPTSDQLLSIAGFYKQINDPINKVQDRGAAGVFSFFNAGEQADVYGIELEARVNILTGEEEGDPNLRFALNATRMWHSQDLKEVRDEQDRFIRTFRYKGLTEEGLQGASDYIFNGNLNFSITSDNPFDVSIVGNYASDKIFALGAPEIQTQSERAFNDAIIEEGYVTLDALITKKIWDNWQIRLTGRNLLNPQIKRTQNVRTFNNADFTDNKVTVRSYDLGSTFLLGLSYEF